MRSFKQKIKDWEMMSPKFSIIITATDEIKFIHTYMSILDQLYSNYQIIVVSDVINESIVDKIKVTRPDQKHILFTTKFISVEKSFGIPGYLKNIGIVFATGDYILFMDDDMNFNDEFSLEFLSQTLMKAQTLPDLVTFNCKIKDNNGVVHQIDFPTAFGDLSKIKVQTYDKPLPSCTFAVLKTVAEMSPWNLAYFDPNPTKDFLGRVMNKAIEILHINSTIFVVHYNENSHEKVITNYIQTICNTSKNAVTI